MTSPALHGFIIADKPVGITSFDVVRIVRKHLGIRKIGHAGTLDPFASGVLLLAVGNATKALSSLILAQKTYLAKIVFGVDSNTLDIDGALQLGDAIPQFSGRELQAALSAFNGEIEQIPPDYSAVKIAGKRACDRVRKGESVTLVPKKVLLHDSELLELNILHAGLFANRPCAEIRLHVGSGFYVRSFARDLGQYLGTSAIVVSLRRESVGRFQVKNAITPDEVTAADIFSVSSHDFPYPPLTLTPSQWIDFSHGRKTQIGEHPNGKTSVFYEGEWVGFGIIAEGSLFPETVVMGNREQ